MTASQVRFDVPALTVPFAATTVSLNLLARAALVYGYSFRETTSTQSASIDILDGNDANGALAATITLLPGQSLRDDFGPRGLLFQSGPFIRINAGSVIGALWCVDLSRAGSFAIAAGDQ